jgi:hypothetical protein
VVIHQEAETTSGGYQYADAGEAHGLELKACPFEYQLITTIYIFVHVGLRKKDPPLPPNPVDNP